MTYLWKSLMRREGDEPLRGQVAMQQHGSDVYIIVMPGPGTFPADAVISMDDARALRNALTGLLGDAG